MRHSLAAVILAFPVAAWAQAPAPPQTPGPMPPPPSSAGTAATAGAPRITSGAQIAPGRWNVDQVRCSDLLGAADDDRAAAAMFYYGYLAAKAGIHVINVRRIDGNIKKVMDRCAATPNTTVPQAFREALGGRR